MASSGDQPGLRGQPVLVSSLRDQQISADIYAAMRETVCFSVAQLPTKCRYAKDFGIPCCQILHRVQIVEL